MRVQRLQKSAPSDVDFEVKEMEAAQRCQLSGGMLNSQSFIAVPDDASGWRLFLLQCVVK